jgi:hypothetical protein
MSRRRRLLVFQVAPNKVVTYTRADLIFLTTKNVLYRGRTPTYFLPRVERGRMKEGEL